MSKSANAVSFYAVESVVVNGKRTSRVVKKLGTLKELEAKLNGEDPYEWAKAEVKRLTDEAKPKKRTITIELSMNEPLPLTRCTFNFAQLFLEAIYNELGLNAICTQIKERNNISYDINEILKTLVTTRILFPDSSKSPIEIAECYINPPSIKADDIDTLYEALAFFAKEKNFIKSSLSEMNTKYMGKSTKFLTYEYNDFYFTVGTENLPIDYLRDSHHIACYLTKLIYKALETKLKHNFQEKQLKFVAKQKILHDLTTMKLSILKPGVYMPSYSRSNITDALFEIFAFRLNYQIIFQEDLDKILESVKNVRRIRPIY